MRIRNHCLALHGLSSIKESFQRQGWCCPHADERQEDLSHVSCFGKDAVAENSRYFQHLIPAVPSPRGLEQSNLCEGFSLSLFS